MKKVIVFRRDKNSDVYFKSPDSCHKWLRKNDYPVHVHFSVFRKWLIADCHYEVGVGQGMVTIEPVI